MNTRCVRAQLLQFLDSNLPPDSIHFSSEMAWGRVRLFCIGVLVMGIEHLLRNKQLHLAEPVRWTNEPTGDALSLLEEEPALWGDEHTDDVHSLLEENARLRALLVQLSDLIRRNVVHAR
jgi:hypothetical protein